jgi:succinyl-CoA synthetase beta subunit
MNIHEYQAKDLLAKYGVAVPKGIPAMSVADAVKAAEELQKGGTTLFVVKAQIHAGGRGAGKFKNNPTGKGGVRLCKTIDEVKAAAEAMLGQTLVTIQTGPDGKEVQRLYVTDGVDIEKEYYCSVLLDRSTSALDIARQQEVGFAANQTKLLTQVRHGLSPDSVQEVPQPKPHCAVATEHAWRRRQTTPNTRKSRCQRRRCSASGRLGHGPRLR